MTATAASPESATDEKPKRPGALTTDQWNLWKNRLDRAKQHHEPYWDAADKIRKTWLGRKDVEADENEEPGPVNLISSFIGVSLPQVLPANPWPMVDANRPGDEYAEGAKRLEARLRQVFGQPAVYRQLRRALLDAYFLRGYIVTVWIPATSRYAARPESKDQVAGKAPTEVASEAPELESDMPMPLYVSYRDVFMDPDAPSFDAADWKGYVVEKRLEDIQASDQGNGGPYHDTDKVRSNDEMQEGEHGTRDKADERAKIYTIFHRGRVPGEIGILVLAGANKTEIRHAYVRLGTPSFPIRAIEFCDVGRLFPASPEQFWLDLAIAFNEFVAEATDRARQSKNVVVCSSEEIRNSVATAKGMTTLVAPDPHAQVAVVPLGGLHPDTVAAASLFERLTDKISGVADFQRGIGSEGDKTASEVNWMVQFTQTRLGDLQGAANRGLREVATDVAGMLLAHQWEEVPVKIEEGPNRVRFETFSKSSVPGPLEGYAFDIDVAEQTRQNPQVRAKRTQDTLEIVSNPELQMAAQAEGKRISVTAALEDHLEAIGVRDTKRYLLDLPSPAELAQAEIEKATQESATMAETGQVLPVEVTDNHVLHAKVHRQADDAASAEHLAEHYAFLASAQTTQGPTPGGSMAPGGARGSPRRTAVAPAGAGGLMGEAGRVA